MHHDIIIAMILGIIMLGLIMFFLFHEYFTEDDVDWEACRQSIVLRNMMPEKTLLGVIDYSSKEYVPLKCKTQIVDINYLDKKKAEQQFLDVMASCWYLVGEGNFKFFAHDGGDAKTRCLVCARISIDQKYEKDYVGDKSISFGEAIVNGKVNGGSAKEYFFPKDGIRAIPYGNYGWQETFKVYSGGHKMSLTSAAFIVSGIMDIAKWLTSNADEKGAGFGLPAKYIPGRGDVLVVISSVATKDERVAPMLLFLQSDDFEELGKPLGSFGGLNFDKLLSRNPLKGFEKTQLVPCDSFESIPA